MGTQEIVVELVCAVILNRDPVIQECTSIDWDKLMTYSHEEGVLSIVWNGLCKLPIEQKPERSYIINWGLSAQYIKERYELHKSVLMDMIRECNNRGLRFLLLKGIGLSTLYPNPYMRESGDIDFYLYGNYREGNRIFAPKKFAEGRKHSSFIYKGVKVENHSVMIDQYCKRNRQIELYLENVSLSAKKQPEGYYVLPPLANIIYIIMHSIHHLCMDYKLPIRSLLDFVVVLKNGKQLIFGSESKELFEKYDLKNHYELMLYLSEWLLNIDLGCYHLFQFDEKEKKCAYETLVVSKDLNVIPNNLPYFLQLKKFISRRKRFDWLHKYEPMPYYYRLYRILWIQTYIIAKKILKLPENESFKESFRKKFCARKIK